MSMRSQPTDPASADQEPSPPLWRRRWVLRTLGVSAIAGVGTLGYAIGVEPHWVEIVRRPLPVGGLPPSWSGRTVVQLSDLHLGPQVSEDYLRDVFRQVKALDPDLVLYTGDFTSYCDDLSARMDRAFADLPVGKRGTFGILGNHDYGPNWAHPEIADEVVVAVRRRGVKVLRNTKAVVDGLQIVGLDDFWAHQCSVSQGLANLDPRQAALVMSHNPDTVDLPGWRNYHGWILSGHTHGGQCKAPFLPPPLLPVTNRRYTAGEFSLDGGRSLYINRGVGHLIQVRFNVRPEVTVFEMRPA